MPIINHSKRTVVYQRVMNTERKTQIFFIWVEQSGQIFLAGYFWAVKRPHRWQHMCVKVNVESSLNFNLFSNKYPINWFFCPFYSHSKRLLYCRGCTKTKCNKTLNVVYQERLWNGLPYFYWVETIFSVEILTWR